ncbi:hypothetical protein KQX54_016427 [Cotesia glomerata]|uniref:Uncharacterized protein n=1 Tax=Cotesia glomerata TaxID=32391 RepID=A0AAV7HXJ9_COTGL|nr:hypothetical protein KQX54_016427 [Cotesia glomerata]
MELKFIILTLGVTLPFLPLLLAAKDGESCTEDEDCDYDSICHKKECKYLCGPEINLCPGRSCLLKANHVASCGVLTSLIMGEDCNNNKDCAYNLKCNLEKKKCHNPCVDYKDCEKNGTTCFVINHETICHSLTPFCQNDNDCADCMKCSGITCVNPCKDLLCVTGKKCVSINHKATCVEDEAALVSGTTGHKTCPCPWWDPFCFLGFYSYLC